MDQIQINYRTGPKIVKPTYYARTIVMILKKKTWYFSDTLKTRLELDSFYNTTLSR